VHEKIEGRACLQALGRDGIGTQQRRFFRYVILPQKPGGGERSGFNTRKAESQSLRPAAVTAAGEGFTKKALELYVGQGEGMGQWMLLLTPGSGGRSEGQS
jgi:hypothetical protein